MADEHDSAPFRDYLFSYRYEGSEWGFTIRAASEIDAKRRLSAMGLARYDGELVATIPVTEKFGIGAMVRKLLGAA